MGVTLPDYANYVTTLELAVIALLLAALTTRELFNNAQSDRLKAVGRGLNHTIVTLSMVFVVSFGYRLVTLLDIG